MSLAVQLDGLGHIGYLLLCGGTFLIAERVRFGWVCRFVGTLLWLIIGYYLCMTSIMLWSLVFMVLESRGWWKWRKRE